MQIDLLFDPFGVPWRDVREGAIAAEGDDIAVALLDGSSGPGAQIRGALRLGKIGGMIFLREVALNRRQNSTGGASSCHRIDDNQRFGMHARRSRYAGAGGSERTIVLLRLTRIAEGYVTRNRRTQRQRAEASAL